MKRNREFRNNLILLAMLAVGGVAQKLLELRIAEEKLSSIYGWLFGTAIAFFICVLYEFFKPKVEAHVNKNSHPLKKYGGVWVACSDKTDEDNCLVIYVGYDTEAATHQIELHSYRVATESVVERNEFSAYYLSEISSSNNIHTYFFGSEDPSQSQSRVFVEFCPAKRCCWLIERDGAQRISFSTLSFLGNDVDNEHTYDFMAIAQNRWRELYSEIPIIAIHTPMKEETPLPVKTSDVPLSQRNVYRADPQTNPTTEPYSSTSKGGSNYESQ